jgi:hypothetical protein
MKTIAVKSPIASDSTPADGTITVNIYNETGFDLTYFGSWFNVGQIQNNTNFPTTIANGTMGSWVCTGTPGEDECSGLAVYTITNAIGTAPITFSYSCPSPGSNKIAIGYSNVLGNTNPMWENMSSQYDAWSLANFSSSAGSFFSMITNKSGDYTDAIYILYTQP